MHGMGIPDLNCSTIERGLCTSEAHSTWLFFFLFLPCRCLSRILSLARLLLPARHSLRTLAKSHQTDTPAGSQQLLCLLPALNTGNQTARHQPLPSAERFHTISNLYAGTLTTFVNESAAQLTQHFPRSPRPFMMGKVQCIS